MATKIYIKHGTGAPGDTDIAGPGELAIDVQNKLIYTKDLNGDVIMLGADLSSSTLDWGQITGKPSEYPPEDHFHGYDDVTASGNDSDPQTLTKEIADILQAIADIESEIGALQGQMTFGGTVDMSTDTITSVTDAGADKGFSVGNIPNPPPAGSENIYFIVEKGGDFDGGTYNSGDWLVSEGGTNGWTGVHFDATVSVDWSQIGGIPSEFPPEPHFHAISDVTDLQTELDGKADVGHTHEIADVTGLKDSLDDKASVDTIICGTY
jgi:hypothetical protein